MSFNIAIDGPAGAGKSTIAKQLAKDLGFVYVDTGAMYRAISLYLIRKEIAADDVKSIESVLDDIDIVLEYDNGTQLVMLNGENVNDLIRTQEVSAMTSASSKNACVREKLVELQRILASKQDVVMDGRDIGTCVLPNADLKIYLTASSKERAMRRWKEYNEKGIECDVNKIEEEIIARDNQDMTREVSPLKQAEDAVYVDTSDMTIDEVINHLYKLAKDRM
ncbi:MAG: (d)CMP kinase [Clostridia bacterium]|nr:(d)CMP kinase [Clostridia bacterium]